MRVLVTGGAGFIGSHLVDALTRDANEVTVLDDLSTGQIENISDHVGSGSLRFVEGSTSNPDLVRDLLADADACYHLASAVGVELVCDEPKRSLLSTVHGCENVILGAAEHDVRLIYASTSEIYGKNSGGPLSEDSDRVLGSLTRSRWCYSLGKSFGEMLAYESVREDGARATVVRLFNTVGPRQSGAYGMVVPRLVGQALAGDPLTVYGDGSQSRCFVHVLDTVEALLGMLECEASVGGVFNIGSEHSMTINELALKVLERTDSSSPITYVDYKQAYGAGFEELGARQPDTRAIRELLGWISTRTIEEIIDDVAGVQSMAIDASTASPAS